MNIFQSKKTALNPLLSYWIFPHNEDCFHLKQVIPDDRLSWVKLQQHGLNGIIQGHRRVKDEVLEFVLEEVGKE